MFDNITVGTVLSMYNPFNKTYFFDEVRKVKSKTIITSNFYTINKSDNSVKTTCLEANIATPLQIENYTKYVSRMPVISDIKIVKAINTIYTEEDSIAEELFESVCDFVDYYFESQDLLNYINTKTNNKFIILTNSGEYRITKFKYCQVSYESSTPMFLKKIIDANENK
jgi:hypothetical protein